MLIPVGCDKSCSCCNTYITQKLYKKINSKVTINKARLNLKIYSDNPQEGRKRETEDRLLEEINR